MSDPLLAKAATTLQLPSFEEIPIYRLQLAVTTGVGDDAGTDSGLSVQFHELDPKFWLSKAIDNFEEGHTDMYDVLSKRVNKVKDLHFIRFVNKGDDGIAIKKIQLFINNNRNPIFAKQDPGRGMVTDDERPYTISATELRAHAGWRYNANNNELAKPPLVISKEMIVSLVEAAIGNAITSMSDIGWGSMNGRPFNAGDTRWGPCVEANYVNNRTIHFDLDLQKALGGPNPELDVDFDLTFTCNNGVINTEMKNVVTKTNWVGTAQEYLRAKIADFLGKAIGSYLKNDGAGTGAAGLLAEFLSFSMKSDPVHPTLSASCKLINVDKTCNIHLQ